MKRCLIIGLLGVDSYFPYAYYYLLSSLKILPVARRVLFLKFQILAEKVGSSIKVYLSNKLSLVILPAFNDHFFT